MNADLKHALSALGLEKDQVSSFLTGVLNAINAPEQETNMQVSASSDIDVPRPEKTVYSYYFPETREAVNRVIANYPHDEFLKNYKPGLDKAHEPLMDLYQETFEKNVIGFDTFDHRYYTNGSSEGIFHLLSKYRGKNFYQITGEYQGYSEFAKALGFHIVDVTLHDRLENFPRGIFVISNPSARHGNTCTQVVERILDAGHQVILDLAYLGCYGTFYQGIVNPNILAVVSSMSKPFGLYYYRVGFCWSRKPIDSLYGNKWFKNLFSIKVAEEVLRSIDLVKFQDRNRDWQLRAIEQAKNDHDIFMLASQVPLLGYSSFIDTEYARGSDSRYCLTPYFHKYDKESS